MHPPTHTSADTGWPAAVRRDDLRAIGLFGALPDEVLDELAATLPVTVVDAGSMVFREGDDGRSMYVILDGEVHIAKAGPGAHDVSVAILGPGEWFGEMSILDVQRRSATARAVAASRLLVITARDLDALYRRDLKAYAIVVLNMARELSRRLRHADDVVAGNAGVRRA